MSYTSEAKIEAVLQIAITPTSDPNADELEVWIAEEEAYMDVRNLGSYTATDEVISVGNPPFAIPITEAGWYGNPLHPRTATGISAYYREEVYPSHLPIIAVTSLNINRAQPGSAEDWQAATEGPAAQSSFTVDYVGYPGGRLGVSLRFHANYPMVGSARIKMTYTYGYNFTASLLADYATARCAVRVMETMAANQDVNIDLESGAWAGLHKSLLRRIRELDVMFLDRMKLIPKQRVPVAVL